MDYTIAGLDILADNLWQHSINLSSPLLVLEFHTVVVINALCAAVIAISHRAKQFFANQIIIINSFTRKCVEGQYI